MERQPLLDGDNPADPPIDDDDFNYEDHKFPTQLQVHLIFANYLLSVLVSRIWEAASPVIISLCYKDSFVAISIYAALMALSGPRFEQYARSKVARSPRFKLMRNVILQHRMFPFLATILLSAASDWVIHGWMRDLAAVAAIACMIAGRAGTVTQLLAIETDWTHIMSNEQKSRCDSIVRHLQLIAFSASLLAPVITGVLISSLYVQKALKVIRIALVASMLLEYSLIYQLYSTCYALSVPRPPVAEFSHNAGSTLPGITFRKVTQYVWLKPRPVVCSLAIILLKVSLISIGPQMLFYLLNHDNMPIWVASLLPSIQLLSYMVPTAFSTIPVAVIDFVLIGLVMVLIKTDTPWSGYAAAAATIVSKSCLHVLDQSAQYYTEDLVRDKAVLGQFRRAETHTLRVLDVFSQCLTLVWTDPAKFSIPIFISGSFGVLGLGMFVASRGRTA